MMNTISAYETLPDGPDGPKGTQHGYRKQLKAGIWLDGEFDWYSEEEIAVQSDGQIRSLMQSYSKQHISYVRCTIKNTSPFLKLPKMVFHYENFRDPQNVAFYSPGEQAILHIGKKSIALLGGVVKGKGISQYCIQGKGSLYQHGCFKSLKEGILSYSPLAKGEVSSVFSLETELQPDECIEAVAWVIHTNTKEEALFMHDKLIAAFPN